MNTFQGDVIRRFITGENYKQFVEDYKNARLLNKILKEPSDNDKRIAQALKKTKSVSHCAKVFKIDAYQVYKSLARVEAWQK